MGWSDCLNPTSFSECTIRSIIPAFWFMDLPGVNIPGEENLINVGISPEEGLYGYENELKVLLLLGLGYVVVKRVIT